MAFCEVKFFSVSVQKAVSMNVILPEIDDPGPYPTFTLCHGLSDDHSIWHRRTRIEWYVRDLPLIVVMPDAGRSWYCDTAAGAAYETFMTKDLIEFVDRFFPTIPTREGRVIGGLSMGGYGAMKLGLKYPHLYCGVTSHSGAMNAANMLPEGDSGEMGLLFGNRPAGGPNDLYALAEKADKGSLPAIQFDCGKDDWLIEHNRAFHDHLDSLGIPHEYRECPGEHSWDYWDARVQEALTFHRALLRI